MAWDRFWLLAGAFSGFLIVAPILATGLYHVSRAGSSGRRAGMGEVMALWRSGDGRLVRFGLLLGVAGTGWVLTSAALITARKAYDPPPMKAPSDWNGPVFVSLDIGFTALKVSSPLGLAGLSGGRTRPPACLTGTGMSWAVTASRRGS
jgi:hypothetical protein